MAPPTGARPAGPAATLAEQRASNQQLQRLLQARAIQPKLTVNQPGDRFEQEADRVADAVMRMPEPRNMRQCPMCQEQPHSSPAPIQRLCSKCEEESARSSTRQASESPDSAPDVPPTIASRIQSFQGRGQQLPAAVRNFFEPRFGQDFTDVRVHTDVASTRSLQARAYTVGKNIVFGGGQYAPGTDEGKKLLAHELTHTVQQKGAIPRLLQRAGDPAAIPPTLRCPTDFTPGRPAGTELLFDTGRSSITPAHTTLLTTLRTTWLAAGGTDDIIVHGYASTFGDQGPNWTLSCDRAEAVQAELVRLGIPPVRMSVVAHGESTDFGAATAANQIAVATTRAAGILHLPIVIGLLIARDNFSGRSVSEFGVGETIDLRFLALPPRPAAAFGGLEWILVSGGGTLLPGLVPNDGTATYTAPATASAVRLELRVAAGATAGRVISTHAITIVPPSGVRMTAVPGTAPNTSPTGGTIPAGTFGAGFLANVFVDPKQVSFQGVVFGEGTVPGVVTPPGSFLGPPSAHPPSLFGPAHGGNATTGTPVSPPRDRIATARPPSGTMLTIPTCGASDFLWAIPWQFSVAGGPATPFATANHHETSTFFCAATIEKGGAGPFCRNINGTTC